MKTLKGKVMENDTKNEAQTNNLIENKKTEKKHLSKTVDALLVSHGLNNAISVFVTTFLISYIYSISDNYIVGIGLFYTCTYIVMAIFYYLISKVIDKTNRVTFYRIAIIIRAVFILAVVFAGKDLAKYVALAGVLYGFSEACYWTSYNIMKNELVSKSLMNRYATIQEANEKLINVVVPLILGRLIDSQSFKISAILVLCLAIIQIVASIFIKSHRPENSSFDYRDYVNKVNSLGEKKKLVTWCVLLGGIYGAVSVISPLNTIFIMLTFNSNFSLGIITSVFAAISVVYLLFLNKFTKTGKRSYLFWLSAILPVVATMVLIFIPNKATLIIFNLIFVVCTVTHTFAFDVSRNVVLKKLEMYDSIAEFQASIEIAMELTRTAVFLLMTIAGLIGASFGIAGLEITAKILLGISIFFMMFMNLCLVKYEKNLAKFGIC
jgi:MFS family permease